jgi:hypothetical protein
MKRADEEHGGGGGGRGRGGAEHLLKNFLFGGVPALQGAPVLRKILREADGNGLVDIVQVVQRAVE